MRGPLNPYVLGGGASTALLAAVLAAFVSLATLVSEPSLSPSGVAGTGSHAGRALEIDLGADDGQRLGPSGLAAGVATLPSAPLGALASVLDRAPERTDGVRAGDGERGQGDGRGGDGARGGGGEDAAVSPPRGAPSIPLFPSPPTTPVETATPGRALGHLQGAAAPPGHGGSPPGRAKRGGGAAPRTSAASPARPSSAPANKNGKVQPGQAKKNR